MESLAGNFLISTPQMPDPRFQEQVIYLCAHNDEGAMGLVVNNPNPEITLLDVFHGSHLAIPEGPLPPVYMGGPVEVDAIYVNAASCAPALLEAMRKSPLSVTQFPAREEERPAHVVIGSAADLKGCGMEDLWRAAGRVAGERLSCLVVTDGPEPVRLYDGADLTLVPPPERLALTDTIGAGDMFAGGFLHALLQGESPPQAALLACRLTEERLLERRQGAA